MKRIAYLLILIVLTVLVKAQKNDPINGYDKQGRRHGYWKKEINGKLKYEGRFVHGIPVDTFKHYFPNGKLKAILVYADSGKKAKAFLYDPTGYLLSEGTYVHMKKEGMWRFYTSEKKLQREVEYKNDKKNGRCVTYFPDEKVAVIEHFVNDTLEGEFKQYYDNGNLHYGGTFSKNMRNGSFVFYYYNGNISAEGFYKNDLRDGPWKLYDNEGKLILEATYRQGRMIAKKVYQPNKDPDELQRIDFELDLKARKQRKEAEKRKQVNDESEDVE